MSTQANPKMNEGQGEDHATAARNEEKGDIANVLEDRAAKEGIDNAVHADAGKDMSLETTTAGSLVESSVLRPLPSAPAPSIASILRLHPGFSSRKIDQAVATPPGGESSGWRVSRSQFSDSLSLTGRAERANGILRMPKSAMGIGFGENERLKHARFQISPQVIRDIRPRKYLPPARRGSVAGEEVDRKERRNSLNDSTHRRMLADSLSTNQQTRPAKAGTTVPVKFPETTVIGPGRLPTFEEQKLIRLARGTAIATVKTVIARPADGNREKHSTGLSRSLLSIEREARREEDRKDASSEPKGSALPVTSTANLLAEGKPVPRTDIILCKFYHTPGLKCTASPCRFIHEINRTALLSPIAKNSNAKMASASASKLGNSQEDEDADPVVEEPVEIVEVFRMSGGGKGAGSVFAKAKFKTVTCRDFAAGYCFYGNFCSFKHELPGETDDMERNKVPSTTKGESDAHTCGSDDLKSGPREDLTAKADRAMCATVLPLVPMLEEDVSPADKECGQKADSTEGDPQRDVSSLQPPLSTVAKSTKDTIIDVSETIAPLSPRESLCTIVAPKPNPSIMLEDCPLTWSREGTPLPSGNKAIKFKSSNIIVPDYRWTKDEGLVASPSAAALEFSQALPDMQMLASSSRTLPIWSSGKLYGDSLNWVDQISPRTIVTPVQYANAPPMETWRKIQPLDTDRLNTAGNSVHQSVAGTSNAQDESPLLPITAYSFSTDSSPPETPATHQQEIVTPENHDIDLPAIHILQDTVAQARDDRQSVEAWRAQEHLAQLNRLAAGRHDDQYSTTSIYPWMVEAFLQHLDPAHVNELWLNDPLSSGYEPAMSKNQFARQLARQARIGDLPPQVPQNKTNYRTKPCKFFVEGSCPHNEKCTYSHDPDVIGRASKNAGLVPHKLRTQPCKFYNSAEGCHVGDKCTFLHQYIVPAGVPLVSRPRPWRTKLCRHYAEGKCLAGDKCHFAHVKSVTPQDKVTKAGSNRKKKGLVESEDNAHDSQVSHENHSPSKASNPKSPNKKKMNKVSRTDDIEIVMNA